MHQLYPGETFHLCAWSIASEINFRIGKETYRQQVLCFQVELNTDCSPSPSASGKGGHRKLKAISLISYSFIFFPSLLARIKMPLGNKGTVMVMDYFNMVVSDPH